MTGATGHAGPGPVHQHHGYSLDHQLTPGCPLDCLYLKLSSAAYNPLERELPARLGHPVTIGDVITLHRQRRLSEIRHLGARRIGEIELVLVVHGFSVAPDDHPPKEPPAAGHIPGRT